MVAQDKHLENVFPEAPLIAYKRQKNIKETITKSKLAPERLREKRVLNGMKKCRKCIVCSYVLEGNIIQSKDFTWHINKKTSCQDSNIIYLIECQKERCKLRYIGFTTQEFRERMCQHLGYIRNKNSNKAIGEHFNLPGHSSNDFKCTIIEKVRSVDPLYGREREKIHIRKFNTFYNGLNREP